MLAKYVKRLCLKDEYIQLIVKYNEGGCTFFKESNMEFLVYVSGRNKEQFLTTQALVRLFGLKTVHITDVDKQLNSIKDKMENNSVVIT